MNNIDIYYESIKQVSERIKKWEYPKPPLWERVIDVVSIISGFLFGFTLIPIVPSILVIVGGIFGLSVFSIVLRDATFLNFGVIWITGTVIFLIFMMLMIWVSGKVASRLQTKSKPPQSLSPEQLTFVAVYESYKELKIFFVSHIEQHIQKSFKALEQALPYEPKFGFEPDPMPYADQRLRFAWGEQLGIRRNLYGNADLVTQVLVASSFLATFEQYAWFQLDSKTKATLQAIISFAQKIPLRLEDKKDLPRVLSVLENLSKFTYAYLPEHDTYMEAATLKELHLEGEKCLTDFVQEVNELTSYSRSEKKIDSKQGIVPNLIDKVKVKFSENIFFRFLVWFFMMLTLTSVTVVIINQYLPLSPDTMVTGIFSIIRGRTRRWTTTSPG